MTDIENYSDLIDSIFGNDTTTFDTSKDIYNHVIGALNNPTEYIDFTENFKDRLKRLKRIYSINNTYFKEIIVQVNNIGSEKNWQGAYAELAAFDYLNTDILGDQIYIQKPIKPNVTLSEKVSYALELGKKETNLDGFVEDAPLYFDIKCLKDNVTEILEGIYNDYKNQSGISNLNITAEYELDMSYDDFKSKRKNLLQELKDNLTTQPKYFKGSVVSGLSYRILWGSGVSSAMRTYHPYKHAKNYHKTVFNYANKFLKKEPTIIILVTFPWYNIVIRNFADSNIKLYRSMARRVFCQYINDKSNFNSFNSSFNGSETIFDVSKKISAILFLEDNSILNKDSNDTNVKSYLYLNPNADNPIQQSTARNFIMGFRHGDFDDFEFDNY